MTDKHLIPICSTHPTIVIPIGDDFRFTISSDSEMLQIKLEDFEDKQVISLALHEWECDALSAAIFMINRHIRDFNKDQ